MRLFLATAKSTSASPFIPLVETREQTGEQTDEQRLMHMLITMSTLDNTPPAALMLTQHFLLHTLVRKALRGNLPWICFFMGLDKSNQC